MKIEKHIVILGTILIVLNTPWLLFWCFNNSEWQPMISLLLIGATCAAVLVPYWFIQVIRKRRWITLGFMVVPNGYFVIRCISELTTQLPNAFGKFFLFTMILGLMFASSAIILLVDAVIGFAIRIVHKKKVIKETL